VCCHGYEIVVHYLTDLSIRRRTPVCVDATGASNKHLCVPTGIPPERNLKAVAWDSLFVRNRSTDTDQSTLFQTASFSGKGRRINIYVCKDDAMAELNILLQPSPEVPATEENA
jgi:hypothetical protein